MNNEMTLKEAIDRLKLFGYYMDETPGGAIEVIVKAFEQKENYIDRIIAKLKESDFYIDQEKCITVEDAIAIVKGGLEE